MVQSGVLLRIHVCWGLNSSLFSYGRDGHQPYSKGLYTNEKYSLQTWDDHPQYKELIDPGTYLLYII